MFSFLCIFNGFMNLLKNQSFKFYRSIMIRRPGEFFLKRIENYEKPTNASFHLSEYSRPQHYCIPQKTNHFLVPNIINKNKNTEYLLYYSRVSETFGNTLSVLSSYKSDVFAYIVLMSLLLLYFFLKYDTTKIRERVLSFNKPSEYKFYDIDSEVFSSRTLVNSKSDLSATNDSFISSNDDNVLTVKQHNLSELVINSMSPEPQEEKKPFLPLDFDINKKFGISDTVQKFYNQQLEQKKFLNESQRNEKLENFLFDMLDFNDENKKFLVIDLTKTFKLSSKNTTYNEITKCFKSKDFEALDKVDISGFGEDLVLTNDLLSLKLTLFSINVLLNYTSSERSKIIKKALVSNLSLILKKFHKVAETYGDEELFNYFLITIINLYSELFDESVHVTQLKKCLKTLADISCSSSIWNLRPKKCFYCCAIMMCSLRFGSIQKYFDDLFPFEEIYNRDVKENVKIKTVLFYLSICQILMLNYIGRNINSVEDIDYFVQIITAKVDTDKLKDWPTINSHLQEIHYIQEYYSDLKLHTV